jgi:hypothetical protein
MIFRQQGEVWDYYKSTRLSTKVWAHWSVRVTSIGFLVFGLFSFFSYILPIGIRIIPAWIRIVGLGLMWVFFCLTIRATKRAQDKMYTREYTSYRLDSSRDRRYLRYVLFLRKLADKKYTREDIAKLRQAAYSTRKLPPIPRQTCH